MGEIFVHINVSLDGYIERENHDIEWQFVDDEFEEYINESVPERAGHVGESTSSKVPVKEGTGEAVLLPASARCVSR